MKKALVFFMTIMVFGCQKAGVEKPNNLIEEDKMVNILYDISLLEAVKTQSINGGITSKQINDFIYSKYKIDSIQFVNSNKYYASNISEYKKMYQKVKEKLESNSKDLEEEINKEKNKSTPTNPKDSVATETPAVY